MKFRHLMLLLAAAALLVGLASLTSRRQRPRPPAWSGKPVLPGLDVNAVRAVAVRKGADAVQLARVGDAWVVTNAFGYPADFAKLRTSLLALKDLTIGHHQPGMKLDDGDTTRVELSGADGQLLAVLVCGGQRQRAAPAEQGFGGGYPDGRYVARAGESDVFLVKEGLESFSTTAKDWIDTQILNVPSADLASIQLTSPGGETVMLDRSSGTLLLAGLADSEEFDSSRSYGIESALGYLRVADIADPALTPEAIGLATGHLYRATLKNGEVYTARIGGTPADRTDRFARFAVELLPAGTNVTADAASPAAQARREQESRVAALQETFGRWTYLISSYTAENMTCTRADLVKAKPAATNAADVVEAPATADAVTKE